MDINAQQWLLTGLVLLCQEGQANLVVVEGGPRAIKKYVHLMTNRVKWGNIPTDQEIEAFRVTREGGEAAPDDGDGGGGNDTEGGKYGPGKGKGEDEDEMEDGSESDSDEEDEMEEDGAYGSGEKNGCKLLWKGVQPVPSFSSFKFSECRTKKGARKELEMRKVVHFWDQVINEMHQED